VRSRSGSCEHGAHESIVVHLDPSGPVGVEPLERFGELLDDDAASDESVKRDPGCSAMCRDGGILALDELEQLRGEVEPELAQGRAELSSVDGAAAIAVKVPEDALPVLDVLPQTGELVERDRPAAIRVEYGHEELDGVEIEGRPVAVDESLLELVGGDVSAAIGIDGAEPLPELGIGTCRRALRSAARESTGLVATTSWWCTIPSSSRRTTVSAAVSASSSSVLLLSSVVCHLIARG